MSNKGIVEGEINDDFTKIHISDRDIEPVLLIYAPQIDYIKPGKLINIMNIPTTEYSQELDSRTNMQLYIDDILANYHNRNIAHLSMIQDRIDKLGGSYNNGKLEFEDNAIKGSLQITIELLEIINSNLNDLLGLVSVNNFLVSMMVGTGVTEVTGLTKTAGSTETTGVSEDFAITNEVENVEKKENVEKTRMTQV